MTDFFDLPTMHGALAAQVGIFFAVAVSAPVVLYGTFVCAS